MYINQLFRSAKSFFNSSNANKRSKRNKKLDAERESGAVERLEVGLVWHQIQSPDMLMVLFVHIPNLSYCKATSSRL